MKFLLIFLASVMLTTAAPRNNYKISGEVKGISNGTEILLFVNYDDMAISIKSAHIYNGKFNFSDTIGSSPVQMFLSNYGNPYVIGKLDFWCGRTDIKITGENNNLSAWKAESDLPEQIIENKILEKTRNIKIEIERLYSVKTNSKDNEIKKRITKQIDSLNCLVSINELDFLENNFNSEIAVQHLCNLAKFADSTNKKRIKAIFQKIDKKYLNSLYGEGLTNFLKDHKAPDVGDYYIDLTAKDTAGIEHKISDYNSEFILLDFWEVGCSACMNALPDLKFLKKKYNDRIEVISYCVITNENKWKETSKNENISWINLFDGKYLYGGAGYLYDINSFPTFILINKEGKIIERWKGYAPGLFKKKLSKYMINNDNLKLE